MSVKQLLVSLSLLLLLVSSLAAANARGFSGGVARVGYGGHYGLGYGDRYGLGYGGYGYDGFGGGYYYDDAAEQDYDVTHNADGSLIGSFDAGPNTNAAPVANPVPAVNEAELLKSADQNYNWGTSKKTDKPSK